MGVPKKNIAGPRIREARLSHQPRLTQDQLSAKLARLGVPIDRAGISKIENGDRQVCDFELKALIRVLKVKAEWLIGG